MKKHIKATETAKAVCKGFATLALMKVGKKGKGLMKKENGLTTEEAERLMNENGGSLDLSGTQIASLPDNLTVGGWLDLSGTQIASLPDNLTVGGSLYLNGTQIASLPDNLTVGGSLDLSGTQVPIDKRKWKTLKNGDYVPKRYIYADNILTHIKSCHTIKGYTFYKGKIDGQNVISDGVNYAHCDTFRNGVADLLFKTAKDRGAYQYKGLTLDSELTPGEMINMYRVITGACKQGTENFVNSLGKLKEKYTIREAIEITKGQYNSEKFKEFFEE